jgi:hypothetical protein
MITRIKIDYADTAKHGLMAFIIATKHQQANFIFSLNKPVSYNAGMVW